ncbi:hypothetical protein [Methylobacterium sp. JK268]
MTADGGARAVGAGMSVPPRRGTLPCAGRRSASARPSLPRPLPVYLSVATTHHPATDLGYLLHKHPGRVHEADLAFGQIVVSAPNASPPCRLQKAEPPDPRPSSREADSAAGSRPRRPGLRSSCHPRGDLLADGLLPRRPGVA